MVLKLVIDTNVLRRETNYYSYNFKIIKKLAKDKYIKVFIPEIVEKEYLSHLDEEFTSNIRDLKKAKRNLFNLINDDIVFRRLSGISKTIEALEKYDKEKIARNWDHFKSELEIEIIRANETLLDDVLSAYFEGNKPFKGVKSRKDFPDAFIYHSVQSYMKDDDYIVICNDEALISAFNESPRVTTFHTVKDFLDYGNVKEITNSFIETSSSQNMTFLRDHKSLFENKAGDYIDDQIIGIIFEEENNVEYEIVASDWGIFHEFEFLKIIESDDLGIRFELQVNAEVVNEKNQGCVFIPMQILIVGVLNCKLGNLKFKSISNLEEMQITDLSINFICEFDG